MFQNGNSPSRLKNFNEQKDRQDQYVLMYEAHKVDSQVSNFGDRGIALMPGSSVREGDGFFLTWQVLGAEVSLVEIIVRM